MGGGRGTHQEELSFLGRCSLQQWQHQQQHRHRLPQLADPWKPWGLVASGCSCCGACCHLEGLGSSHSKIAKKRGKDKTMPCSVNSMGAKCINWAAQMQDCHFAA